MISRPQLSVAAGKSLLRLLYQHPPFAVCVVNHGPYPASIGLLSSWHVLQVWVPLRSAYIAELNNLPQLKLGMATSSLLASVAQAVACGIHSMLQEVERYVYKGS